MTHTWQISLRNLLRLMFSLLFCFASSLFPAIAQGNSDYYRHTYFDNSLNSDFYFYSSGQASAPSSLEQKNWRLPVETKIFLTPPNALRLEWQSQAGGGWEAEVRIVNFRNRLPAFSGDSLYFWCFAPKPISAADLPLMVLSDTREGLQVAELPGSFTAPLPFGKFAGDLPAGRWVQVRIPLSEFRTASIYPFQPQYLQNIIFLQGRADGVRHTLILDEIRVDDGAAQDKAAPDSLPTPQNVQATGYDRHIEVRWDPMDSPALGRYVIYRSLDGKNFEPIGTQLPDTHDYSDFLGKAGVTAQYKVAASDRQYKQSPLSNVAAASTREFTDDELLSMLQAACFRYYWDGADPHSGMARESIPGDDRKIGRASCRERG